MDLLVDRLGNLLGQALLNLEPPGIHVDEARDLAQADLSGLRRALFPALSAAYEQWQHHAHSEALSTVIAQGETHWLKIARELMQTFHTDAQNGDARLNRLAGHLESISL